MDSLKPVGIPSLARFAYPAAAPRVAPAAVPLAPRGDSVSLASPGIAEQPAVQAPSLDAGPSRPSAAPPPTTLTVTEGVPTAAPQEDTLFVLQAFQGTPLETTPELGKVKEKLPQVPGEIRSAASLPLLDVLTNPDIGAARQQLSDIGGALGWAQKYKKDARAAVDLGGFEEVMKRAFATDAAAGAKGSTPLDEVLSASSLLKSGKLGDDQITEANNLLDQFKAGNTSPGIGSSTLGKGIMYLRGRRGTRIFYRMQQGKPEWLAVANKSDEQAAINTLRATFDLR